MGWHSKDIMGGDTPWDYESEIYGICGIDKYDEETDEENPIPREVLLEKQEEINKTFIDSQDGDNGSTSVHIGLQVLGVMLLKFGAEIIPKVKENIYKAIEIDPWAEENFERKCEMKYFKEAVDSHDDKTPRDYGYDLDLNEKESMYPYASSKFSEFATNEIKDGFSDVDGVLSVSNGIIGNHKYGIIVLLDQHKFAEAIKKLPESHREFTLICISNEDFKAV